MTNDEDWRGEVCEQCVFWATFSEHRDAMGQCGMMNAPESIVTAYPLVRKIGTIKWDLTNGPNGDVLEGMEFSAQMVTPHDFGCKAFQRREE